MDIGKVTLHCEDRDIRRQFDVSGDFPALGERVSDSNVVTTTERLNSQTLALVVTVLKSVAVISVISLVIDHELVGFENMIHDSS